MGRCAHCRLVGVRVEAGDTMTKPDFNMSYNAETMKGVTLTVHVQPTKRYAVRVFVALQLIRLAARIAGYGVKVTR